jgi:hypothetical protein
MTVSALATAAARDVSALEKVAGVAARMGREAAATSFEYGATKYTHRNWEKGLPWQQMIDSLKRHIDDFERRHDYDDGIDGSGLHQVCMIMASAMMLSASVIRDIGDDDRLPKLSDEAYSAKDCAKWMKTQLERADEFAKLKESMTIGS